VKNKEEIAAQRDRMKQVLKRLRISRNELAARLGTTKGYVNQVLGGRNSISAGFREKLSKYYSQINIDWVMTGEGDMLLEKKLPEPGVLTGVMEPESPVYEVVPGGGLLESALARLARLEVRLSEMEAERERLRAEFDRRVREIEEELGRLRAEVGDDPGIS